MYVYLVLLYWLVGLYYNHLYPLSVIFYAIICTVLSCNKVVVKSGCVLCVCRSRVEGDRSGGASARKRDSASTIQVSLERKVIEGMERKSKRDCK